MPEKDLTELFESKVKVRLLKLFLNNPQEQFDLAEAVRRTRSSRSQCRRHLNKLVKIGLVKKVKSSNGKKTKKTKKRRAKKNHSTNSR